MIALDLNATSILRPRYKSFGFILLNLFTIDTFRWENKDKDKEKLTREELIFKYFDLLDDDEILSLYSIYENDFKMFGYTFQFRGLRLNL